MDEELESIARSPVSSPVESAPSRPSCPVQDPDFAILRAMRDVPEALKPYDVKAGDMVCTVDCHNVRPLTQFERAKIAQSYLRTPGDFDALGLKFPDTTVDDLCIFLANVGASSSFVQRGSALVPMDLINLVAVPSAGHPGR